MCQHSECFQGELKVEKGRSKRTEGMLDTADGLRQPGTLSKPEALHKPIWIQYLEGFDKMNRRRRIGNRCGYYFW